MLHPRVTWGAPLLAACLLALLPAESAAQEPKQLSLAEALALAAQQSPALVAERFRTEEARGVLVEARAWAPENPWVSASAAPWLAADGSPPWEVEVQQRLEVPGVRAARVSAARAGLESTAAGARDFERAFLWLVASAYYDAVGAREQAAFTAEDEALAADLLAIARLRVDRGADPPIVLGTARIRHAEAGRGALAAEVERRAALLSLAALLGLPPEEIELSSDLPSASVVALDEDALVERALQARPDLLALDRAIDAAEAEVRLARRQSWPDLTLGARYDAAGGDGVGLAVVGLEVPLFRWHQGDRVTASARLERLRFEREALALGVEADVRAAWLRWEAAAAAVKLYDEEVVAALDENLGLLTTMFDAGKVGYGDVATFQRERLAGALGSVEARLDLGHAEVALLSAAGLPLARDGQDGGAR